MATHRVEREMEERFTPYEERLTEEQIEAYVLSAFREFRKDVKEGRLPQLSRMVVYADSTGLVQSVTHSKRCVRTKEFPQARERLVEGHGILWEGHRLSLDQHVEQTIVLETVWSDR